MKRAEFDWRPVVGALAGADLSGIYDADGNLVRPPLPRAWPSPGYETRLAALNKRVTAPERVKGREYGITVAELEAEIEWLLAELARAERAAREATRRRKMAAAWLYEAEVRARRTRIGS